MAAIIVVGSDIPLIEGVSQTLVGAGHQVAVAKDIQEALEILHGVKPLLAVVHRDELLTSGAAFRVSLAPGGALLAFHGDDVDAARLPFSVQRAILAELQLPLERQRLLALVRFVENRAHATGHESTDSDELESRP